MLETPVRFVCLLLPCSYCSHPWPTSLRQRVDVLHWIFSAGHLYSAMIKSVYLYTWSICVCMFILPLLLRTVILCLIFRQPAYVYVQRCIIEIIWAVHSVAVYCASQLKFLYISKEASWSPPENVFMILFSCLKTCFNMMWAAEYFFPCTGLIGSVWRSLTTFQKMPWSHILVHIPPLQWL